MLLLGGWLVYAADAVRPELGWQPGDRWAVQYQGDTARTDAGRPGPTTHTEATWTIVVSGSPKRLELGVEDYAFVPTTGLPANDLTGAYLAAGHAAPMALVVSRGGRSVQRVGLDAVRAHLDAALARTALPTEAAREQIRALLPDAQLVAMGADWWEGLVGRWESGDWRAGEVVPLAVPTPVPALGGIVVDLQVRSRWDGPAPCTPDDAAQRCARFVLTSGFDGEQVTAALEERLGAIAAAQGDAAPVMRSLAMDTTITTVLAPSDMRPVSMEVSRTTRIGMEDRGRPFEGEQVETRRWTFTPLP